MILLDTSGLLSAIDSSQTQHEAAARALRAAGPPLLLSPFVLAELDYRESAWAEHEAIAAQIFAGNAKQAEAAALAHAQTAGRMTEERLRATDEAAA